jgi:outer membrane immunogenic protein
MLKTLVVGAAAALLMTSNAVADGMPRRAAKAMPVCCEPTWTGFYIGVGVGGAFTTHEHSAKFIEDRKYSDGSTTTDVFRLWDLDGGRAHAFGTVTVGYDHQFSGHWVAGLFADYDFGNGKNDHHIREGYWFDHAHLRDENKHAWSIGGRLGFLSSPSTLLYLSTGWTRVSLDRDVSVLDWGGTEHRRSFDKDLNGWFIGAGMETQLGWLHPGLSLRGEYRFTRLDDDHRRINLFEGSACDCSTTLTQRLELDHDVDVHSVRVVLAYKFGRREAVAAPLK